ncbi:MAG: ABC transporter ATP-binding protein [Cyclobacteriaceae bacterium]
MIKGFRQAISVFTPQQRKKFNLLAAANLLLSLLELTTVALILPYINLLQDNKTYLDRIALQFGFDPISIGGRDLIIFATIILGLTYFLKFITEFLVNRWNYLFSERVFTSLVGKLYRGFLEQDYKRFIEFNTGDLKHRVIDQPNRFVTLVRRLVELIRESFLVSLLVAIMLYQEFFISLSMIAAFGFFGYLFHLLLKNRQYAMGRKSHNSYKQIHKWFNQTFLSFKDVFVNQLSDFFNHRFTKDVEEHANNRGLIGFYPKVPRIIFEAFLMLLTFSFVAYYAITGLDVLTILPAIIFYIMVFRRLLPSLSNVLTISLEMKSFKVEVDSILESLRIVEKNKRRDILEDHGFTDSIRFNNISYSYTDRPVLQEVSIEFIKNQTVALVGKSGSGKTTLIEILVSMLSQHQGEILIDGQKVFNTSGIRHLISYVPQDVSLFDMSIEDNIKLGLSSDLDVDTVLEISQLKGFVDELPNGVKTVVGENGIKLSGGQRQRLGIARALYKKSQILILDEATSSLDNLTEKAISNALNELHGKKTIVIVAHRLSTIKDVDSIYLLENGKIKGSGNHESLMKNIPEYHDLYALEAS